MNVAVGERESDLFWPRCDVFRIDGRLLVCGESGVIRPCGGAPASRHPVRFRPQPHGGKIGADAGTRVLPGITRWPSATAGQAGIMPKRRLRGCPTRVGHSLMLTLEKRPIIRGCLPNPVIGDYQRGRPRSVGFQLPIDRRPADLEVPVPSLLQPPGRRLSKPGGHCSTAPFL
jgi:hypothetical protein